MKKLALIGSLTAAVLFAAAQMVPNPSPNVLGAGAPTQSGVHSDIVYPTPYYSTAAQSDTKIADDWSFINANDDYFYGSPATWKAVTDYNDNSIYAVDAGYANPGTMDDYLLSPKIHMEADKKYAVIYTWRVRSSDDEENLSVYLSTETEPEQIKNSIVLDSYSNVKKPVTYTKVTKTVTPENTGDYRVIFHCHSGNYKFGVLVYDLLVAEYKFTPGSVRNLKATPGENEALTCNLKWLLPNKDFFGNELPDGSLTNVKVYRDAPENLIATLPSDADSFEDNASKGLTAGKHTYYVSVVAKENDQAEGVESAMEKVTTSYIGPVEPIAVPAELKIESQDDFELWKAIKGANSGNDATWTFSEQAQCATLTAGYNEMDDDWLITPPVKFENPGYYRLKISAVKSNNYQNKFVLAKGKSATVEAMEILSPEFDLPVGTSDSKPYATSDFEVYISESGVYYFGLHNELGEQHMSGSTYFYLSGIEIEVSQFIPGEVTQLEAVATGDDNENILVTWKNPETDLAGIALDGKTYTVQIYLNDSEQPVTEVTDGSEEVTLTGLEPGIYTVTAKTVADGASAPSAPKVTTGWIGKPMVSSTYSTTFQPDDSSINFWKDFIVDGNHDGNTFVYQNDYYGKNFHLPTEGTSFKDFLVSPYIALEKGTYYKVTVAHSGDWTVQIPCVIGCVKAKAFDPDNYESLIGYQTFQTKGGMEKATESFVFKVHEDGDYQFVIGEVAENITCTYSQLTISSFAIEPVKLYPANVENLTVTTDATEASKVVITWTNPSNHYGTDIALESIEEVIIERNGVAVGSVQDAVPGEESTFIDELPSGNIYTYTVYAVVNSEGHGGEYATSEAKWFGGGAKADDTESFEMDKNHMAWSTLDVDNDYGENMYGWYKANSAWAMNQIESEPDDYLITAPLKIEKGVVYEISFNMSPGFKNSEDYSIDVVMGTGDDCTKFENVKTFSIPKGSGTKPYSFNVAVAKQVAQVKAKTGEKYDGAINIPEGDHRVALHAVNKGGCYVESFSFKKVDEFDPTTGLESIDAVQITFADGAIHFPGTADVKVHNIDGTCVVSATEVEGTLSLAHLAHGCYLVTLTTSSGPTTLKIIL